MTDISRPGVAATQLRDVNRGISGPVIMRAEGVVKTRAAYRSVLMTVQLLLPVWSWNWLVSAYWRTSPSLSQSTSGGSSSSAPDPLRVHCIVTGLPSDEMTVVGLSSNSRSLIKRGIRGQFFCQCFRVKHIKC